MLGNGPTAEQAQLELEPERVKEQLQHSDRLSAWKKFMLVQGCECVPGAIERRHGRVLNRPSPCLFWVDGRNGGYS